jgi:poly(A) polymerase Pap1
MIQLIATAFFMYGAYKLGYISGRFDADIDHIIDNPEQIEMSDFKEKVRNQLSITEEQLN